MSKFNAKKVTNELIEWIKDWFETNGKDCNAVIGISGGVDSSTVAALMVASLGKEHVIGVMMPNGEQSDIDSSYTLVNHLGIKHFEINIDMSCYKILEQMLKQNIEMSLQTHINLPPRIRMATLYAVSQSMNGRVSCNCNLSEDWVGYSTFGGDDFGDFAPLRNLTKTEVKAIAKELNLPKELIEKIPSDGLCGKSDEENLGFTYDVLDRYIREGVIDDIEVQQKIEERHNANLFKLQPMPTFPYENILTN